MEEDDPVRTKKIFALLNKELEDGAGLAAEARKMVLFLLLEKKGYQEADIRKDVVFEVKVGDETAYSSVDILITLKGRKAMIIKCAAGSLDSRERQAVAAARLLNIPPVPVVVVADPVTAEVLDVKTGKVIGEGFGAIPVRDQMLQTLDQDALTPLSPERIEKEKRILLAFDAIKCSVPQGADGGVSLE